MNDDSIVKIMQALDLDYSKAIFSTKHFEQSIESLNKQLAGMKSIAMQSAKDINTAFASQLGQISNDKTIVDQFGKSFKTIKDKAKATALTVNDMTKSIKESSLVQMQAQAASVQQRVTTKGLSDEYAKQASTLREQLSVLQARLQAEGKLSAEETTQTNQLKEQLEILRAQTRTAISDDIRENPSTFGDEWQRRSSWFLSGAMFYGTINAAKEATQTIKDVEMGMVEISRVMTDSTFVFNEYRDNLFKLGIDYGQTFDNVQQIALRWAQSGYNVADSLELTKTSLLALNTAELNATQATEAMIGIMAQWQLQAEDMALVMDKINITADRHSVTSQDLVDGLLRSSGAARVMNLSLEETLGLLTVMREASGRTGQEVGNALNSILSYIQRPKSIDVLEDLGINMFADSAKTQFRNVLDIFKDIASNWNTLSADIQDGFVQSANDAELFTEELAGALGMQEEWNDLQQRDISQAAAGVYRRNYFIGMIERLTNVQGVLNNMMDAEGYSMRENADTMETLEKKQQSLKTSAQALAVAMGDAGLGGSLKALADGGTSALNSINNLPKPMKDLLMATTSTFLAVKTLQMGMKTFDIELPGISQMIASLTSGTWSLTAALKAGGAGLATFASANAPLLALSASIGVIVAVTNAIKKQREEQERFIETTKQSIRQYQQDYEETTKLYKAYATVKEGSEELSSAKKELLDLIPDLLIGYDSEGQAIIATNDKIEEQIQLLKEQAEAKKELLRLTAEDTIAKGQEEVNKLLEKQEKLQKDINSYIRNRDNPDRLGTIEDGTGTLSRAEIIAMKNEQIAAAQRKLSVTSEELEKGFSNLRNSYIALLPPMDNLTAAQRKVTDEFVEATIKEQRYLESGNINASKYTEAFKSAITNTGLLAKAQEELDSAQNKSSNNIKDYATAIEKTSKAFNDTTDKLNRYYQMLNEVNSKEGLSAQSKRDIISNYQELLPYLSDEQELRKQLISIISKKEETQRTAYANMLMDSKEFFNAKIKGNHDLIKKLEEYYKVDLGNAKNLAHAKEMVENELIKSLSGKWAKYYGALTTGHNQMLEDNLVRAAMSGSSEANDVLMAVKAYKDVQSRFENIALDLGGVDFKGINTSGANSSKSSSSGKSENKQLTEALKLLEHRKKISEETQASIKAEIAELNRINSLHVKTADERMNMAERIYSAEKRLRDKTLQDSINWINEKKNLNELSTDEEIAAWERVKKNQSNNIEAVKQATLNLYKLKNQVLTESFDKEENTIKHLTKLGVLSVEEQINKYKELYNIKASTLAEEQSRVENLFNLYKSLLGEQQQATKNAYDERIKQIEKEATRKKQLQEDIIKGIEKELELLNRQEQDYDHDKKMADLKEQLAYWQVRTSEDARKKVTEILKQIDEAEHDREIELQRQGLEDKKKIAQDEVKAIEDAAKEEKEKWEKSYKLVEKAFDTHSTNIVALAATMSKEAYREWEQNYLTPLQNALTMGDFVSFDSISGSLDDSINNFRTNYNEPNYVLVNKDGTSNAKVGDIVVTGGGLYKKNADGTSSKVGDLSGGNTGDYNKVIEEYNRLLPKMHSGGKTLSYGAVYMKPGELVFPPDLSTKLESLVQVLYQRPMQTSSSSSSFADNRKEIKIDKLLNIEKNYIEDEVDGDILVRQLARQLTSIF